MLLEPSGTLLGGTSQTRLTIISLKRRDFLLDSNINPKTFCKMARAAERRDGARNPYIKGPDTVKHPLISAMTSNVPETLTIR